MLKITNYNFLSIVLLLNYTVHLTDIRYAYIIPSLAVSIALQLLAFVFLKEKKFFAILAIQFLDILYNMNNYWDRSLIHFITCAILLVYIIHPNDKQSYKTNLRFMLGLFTFFAGIQKINSGFLSVGVSCVDLFLDTLASDTNNFINLSFFKNQVTYWLVIIGEMSFGLFLLFNRTKKIAEVVLLAGFFFLGLVNVYTMSSQIYTVITMIYFLDCKEKISPKYFFIFPILMLLHLANLYFSEEAYTSILGQVAWGATGIVLGSILVKRIIFQPEPDRSFSFFKEMPVIFLFVFYSFISPHIGLHTFRTLQMFSNLSTEGRETNHYLIPKIEWGRDYQDKHFKILETNMKVPSHYYKHFYPIAEHFRIVKNKEITDEYIIFIDGDLNTYRYEKKELEDLKNLVPWYLAWNFSFRKIHTESCK
jgi:uncharacterized membrane protein YphA (DoxX/SURF4 family)